MHTAHYTPHQGSMAQRHPVGERIFEGLRYVRDLMTNEDINKTGIDRRVIEEQQTYLPSHFNGYDTKVSYPANSSHPHAVHRYDYKILGELYNVYTRDSSDGQQL